MSRHDDTDDLGSATRAFTEAVNLFTKAVGGGAHAAGRDISEQISDALRTASRELADASTTMSRAAQAGTARSRAERTREELVSAARRVFAAKGYEGATVGDIANEAGFTKGALYANFDSKQTLFLEVARTVAEHSAQAIAVDPSGEQGRQAAGAPRAVEDALLVLETWTFALRHPESRDEIAGCWRAAMETAFPGEQKSGGTGSPQEASELRSDRERAATSLISQSLAAVLMAVLAEQPPASARGPREGA